MKKLLIFHPYLAPYRIDLYNYLANLYEVQVLLTGSKTEKNTLGFDLDFVNKLAQFTFSYVESGLYIGRHLLSFVYYKQKSSFRPDVVMAHELGINTLMAIFFKPFFRYKLLVTVDDSPTMIGKYGIIRKKLQQFVIKHSEALLVVHPDVKSYLESEYQTQYTCQFIYFPIIQDEEKLNVKFITAETKTLQLLSRYDFDNKKIILFVGRLEAVKCPDMLLRAFQQLNEKNSILVFVGDGSMDSELKNYVKINRLEAKVIFTGRLTGSALYAWYRLADVFVLPSQFEPFGAVVNEALVAGCFVIVSDKVGSNCLINSSNGKIFKSGNNLDLQLNLKETLNKIEKRPKHYLQENRMIVSFHFFAEQLVTEINNLQKKGSTNLVDIVQKTGTYHLSNNTKPKAIVFYTYLPPWRIDVFNAMGNYYDLTIIFLSADSEGFTYNRKLLLSKLQVKALFWNKGFNIGSKPFRTGIYRMLKNYNPEVVFTHEYSPTSILLASFIKLRLFNFQLIVTTSDNLKMVETVSELKSYFRSFVLKSAKGVVVYSENIKNWYKRYFPGLKVEICPNIQNPETLLGYKKDFPPKLISYMESYRLNKPIVLYVGRLEKVKGVDLLIQAYSHSLKDTHQLVLVGEGSQKEALKTLATNCQVEDRVIFPGFFAGVDLFAWYALADFFVLPSRYEPFGAVVNEALVFGCPVLASKNIGALDYIKEGVNGFIFDPDNSKDFINRLNQASKVFRNNGIVRDNLMPLSFKNYEKAFYTIAQ